MPMPTKTINVIPTQQTYPLDPLTNYVINGVTVCQNTGDHTIRVCENPHSGLNKGFVLRSGQSPIVLSSAGTLYLQTGRTAGELEMQ